MSFADIRREYMRAGLAEAQADPDPLRQFGRWLDDAIKAQVPLANAMTLATVAPSGRPSARVVLLKGVEAGAFVFYTNYLSRKGAELEARAAASLVLFWAELERQVRIEGDAQRIPEADSDAYFATRPLGARLSAWASPQSAAVAGRAVLEESLAAMQKRHGENPPRPPHWGGYRVVPQAIEFWQGRADRLHDRLLYERRGAAWTIARLAP